MPDSPDRWAELLSRGAMAAAGELGSTTIGLKAGTRIGPYEVVSMLGVGGMGEVYRARDPRLGRDVAIKILPPAFTADTDRLARFEREARVLASLNHPHIATIHGIEDANGLPAIVMELVEGDTLADRIGRAAGKGLAVGEALDITRQIADALDAAHEKGIVHRDLKPANITITPQGSVKVLDFGLAKVSPGERAGEAPTITVGDTREGSIVGTAAYMSPEQARGQAVDKRTDIWAFGCVLYEMLTGRAVFARATTSDTVAAILEREPDWTDLSSATPPTIMKLLRRCLTKDPKRRTHDIADVRIELEDAAASSSSAEGSLPVTSRSRTIRRPMWVLAATILLVAAAVAWIAPRYGAPTAESPALKLTLTPPEGTEFATVRGAAISPDGRQLAFVTTSSGTFRLWIRPLNSLEARELPDTDDANLPFWSPDSRALAFFAGGKLKRIDVAGGLPTTISDVSVGKGGTWNEEGIILFNAVNDGPLLRVSAAGGVPVPVTHIDTTRLENSHRWPQFLPGGRRFLYFNRSGPRGPDTSGVYVGSLDRPDEKIRLMSSQTQALYVPDPTGPAGHLFWMRNGTLMAQPFDADKAQTTGDAVAVAEHVAFFENGNGLVAASLSATGLLVYGTQQTDRHQLTWYDRGGKALGGVGQPDAYADPRISPDGTRVGILRGGDGWQIEFARSIATRMTFTSSLSAGPVWSPDSQRVVINQYAPPNLFLHNANGTGNDERLLNSHDGMSQQDWSRDGRFVLYAASSNDPRATSGSDLWILPMSGNREPSPFVTTPFREVHAQFSPDGKWIAYASNESGRNEVYVQSFPASGFKQQVSAKGGDWVRWRGDGRELFYVAPDRMLMAVSVNRAPASLEFSAPTALFTAPSIAAAGGYSYDVAGDGQRFLALAPTSEASSLITVVTNWQSELSAARK